MELLTFKIKYMLWIAVLMQDVNCYKTVYDHGVDLVTTRPLNIGHRGSSGTHPEHTIASYEKAIADGADVIECDVVLTKDLKLVCLHDPYLSPVTDIQKHPEFANRTRVVNVPDYGVKDDWYSFDFTLAELKTLRVHQRDPFRDPKYDGMYQIPTLEEFINVAKSSERKIGIYPEMKVPELFNALDILNGKKFEDLILDVLHSQGYTKATDPCFIQCFNDDSLRYLRPKTQLPLVVLVWADEHIVKPHSNISKVAEWGKMYYGIGAWKIQIADHYNDKNGYKNWIKGTLPLLQEARNAGLKIHLYTYRNEDQYLAWDFQQNPIQEYVYSFRELEVDGYFTDNPGTMDKALQYEYRGEMRCETNTANQNNLYISFLLFSVILCFRSN